jgi:hypothetical protein
MRHTVVIMLNLLCWIVAPAGANEVPLAAHVVTIDGDLREWGQAAWISVEPAADGVGLRGVFHGEQDHDATLLVQWDAEALYIAAAVTDDTLDVGRVLPTQREWNGSGGQRKDRMFYYDHMKVFVREPGANAGYNLWFAPADENGLFWWGGRQRQAEVVHPPIQAASIVRGTTRTFEIAIPWTWMEAYPQPGDVFDGTFLFTDSDRPGEDVAVKIASNMESWIWWQGGLELVGQPDGLRPRPAKEPPRPKQRVIAAAEPLDPRIAEAVARSREIAIAAAADSVRQLAQAQAAAKAAAEAATTVAGAVTGPTAVSGVVATTDVAAASSATGSLRARLNRKMLARRAALRAPQYLQSLDRDPELSDAQVDSFYAVLRRQMDRIVQQRITTRVDFFVIDMASAAGCRRDQSRNFLVDLLAKLAEPHDEVVARWIAAAATTSALDGPSSAAFVHEVSRRAGSTFKKLGITTSQELIKRGRKESGLDEDEAYMLIGSLLSP